MPFAISNYYLKFFSNLGSLLQSHSHYTYMAALNTKYEDLVKGHGILVHAMQNGAQLWKRFNQKY